jgi:hypothetical protein
MPKEPVRPERCRDQNPTLVSTLAMFFFSQTNVTIFLVKNHLSSESHEPLRRICAHHKIPQTARPQIGDVGDLELTEQTPLMETTSTSVE